LANIHNRAHDIIQERYAKNKEFHNIDQFAPHFQVGDRVGNHSNVLIVPSVSKEKWHDCHERKISLDMELGGYNQILHGNTRP